jgi:hypothetical protein
MGTRKLVWSYAALASIGSGKFDVEHDALPHDVRVIDVLLQPERECIVLVLQSEEWEGYWSSALDGGMLAPPVIRRMEGKSHVRD